jgi:hypothetical protein
VSSTPGTAPSRGWGASSTSPLPLLAAAALASLCAAWPTFVFTGSQAAYALSLLASVLASVALARINPALCLLFLLAVLALVGPEVSGQLGTGRAPFGSLRVFDAASVAGAAGIAFGTLRPRAPMWVRPGALGALTAAVLVYASIRWAVEGHRVDSFLRSDLRLIGLALLFWYVARRIADRDVRLLLWGIVWIGALAAAKAAAVHLSGVFAIGSVDRLQASSLYINGQLRTILIGGDTLMILVPALAVLLATGERRIPARLALLGCGVFTLWAIGLSATRTSVLVSLGLTLATVAVLAALGRPGLSRSRVIGGLVLLAMLGSVALVGGAASRLQHADAPHVGLNFRKDEVKAFLKQPAGTKYLGQGLGGRFMAKDVNGHPALSGWAHELPVWVALKTGIVGLLALLAALGIVFRRGIAGLRKSDRRTRSLAGLALVTGLVAMSMTLDRVALPEGMPLFVLGLALILARPGVERAQA